jgi:5-methylcytosine-specific restriction endonuclease McrA
MRCRQCDTDKDTSEFYYRKDSDKYRSECKNCNRLSSIDRRRKKGIPSKEEWLKSYRKYHTEEERKEAARVRAKEWDKNHPGDNQRRSSKWQKSEHGKAKCTAWRNRHKKENPEYWRYKKRVDKSVRISREKDLDPMTKETIMIVEQDNIGRYGELTCFLCEVPTGETYHMEHKIPLSRGGCNSIDNLDIACPPCNLSKGNKTVKEFLRWRK